MLSCTGWAHPSRQSAPPVGIQQNIWALGSDQRLHPACSGQGNARIKRAALVHDRDVNISQCMTHRKWGRIRRECEYCFYTGKFPAFPSATKCEYGVTSK